MDLDDRDAAIDYVSKPPRRKVDDQTLPYYAVDYHQGTTCDITGRPRRTTVYYVCDNDRQSDKGLIRSFDEVSSCEYELVVATSRLCAHPGFRQEKSKEHKIECFPAGGQQSPTTPESLILWEKEAKFRRLYGENEKSGGKNRIIIPFLPKNIDLESILEELNVETLENEQEIEEQETPNTSARPSQEIAQDKIVTKPPADQTLAKSFLAGEQCLYGGSGWWRFEYCHQKHVLQYHVDEQDGSTTAKILLGLWDLDLHSRWLSDRPHKRPFRAQDQSSSGAQDRSSSVLQVSHFYGRGDRCPETERDRSVEVRLKCLTSKDVSLNAVSLTLLEPRTCEYVLRVESPMICEALQTADERGILV
uniref:Endoplasmic reticulum lectin 1 n=1 Tax=Romanomermis culicivorax TaxID=13658 RepID=A0A915JS69_ROMCU